MNNYIGLMSGTSIDAIDAVVVNFADKPQVIAKMSQPLDPEVKHKLAELNEPSFDEINKLGELDIILGRAFANTVNTMLAQNNIDKTSIRAIGSHGQTIRHHPHGPHPFTLQIGDPNIIANLTGIETVADFRRRDMAAGGQGAPLAPAFHQAVFNNAAIDRVIVNLGGIANITLLTHDNRSPVIGYDTGPGNGLLDSWIQQHNNQPYDKNGDWARSGTVDETLLARWLQDPYFQQPAPKSTGKDYFNLPWLGFAGDNTPANIQRTLVELTAATIGNAIHHHFKTAEVLLCGGGVHNQLLVERITALLTDCTVASTDQYGIDPDFLEAIAFAWLAMRTVNGQASNLPDVTGADNAVILGGIYRG